MLLSDRRFFMISFCVFLAMVLSRLFTDHSKNCSMVFPGCFSSSLCWPFWISFVTSSFTEAISRITSFMVSGVGTMSPRPTEKPRFMSQ